MKKNFTIELVRDFWDGVADIYDETNEKIGSAHQQRFIESFKYLQIKPNQKILNIWSRTGKAIPFFRQCNDIDLYNLEVSPLIMAKAQKKFPGERFQLTDLKKTNFANDFFDNILSLETLEHAPEPTEFLKELYRVLKPGGQLILSLPPKTAEIPLIIYELFFKNHGEGPHNFLSSKKVKKMLRAVGFELICHKGTLLCPVGPIWVQKCGEKIINYLQKTPIREFGIRQFYVCKKP